MADIVICDDREEILKDIEAKIRKADVQGVHRILSYNHGMRMMADIEDQLARAEIFILDIALGACSGISLAQEILSFIPDAQIIFMSGYDTYYEDVYDVSHFYFLQKPVKEEALQKALKLAQERLLAAKKACFYVENKSGRFVVPFEEIFLFEKDRRRIIVRGRDGEEICCFTADSAILRIICRDIFIDATTALSSTCPKYGLWAETSLSCLTAGRFRSVVPTYGTAALHSQDIPAVRYISDAKNYCTVNIKEEIGIIGERFIYRFRQTGRANVRRS